MNESCPQAGRILTVQDLAEVLEQLDPTLPLRVVDPREHAQYVTAVAEVAGDPDTGTRSRNGIARAAGAYLDQVLHDEAR
jgi:hypothetical protein